MVGDVEPKDYAAVLHSIARVDQLAPTAPTSSMVANDPFWKANPG